MKRIKLTNEQMDHALGIDMIPELEPYCGSWIATSPDGSVREFFLRANAEKALTNGWKVETSAQYLARINTYWKSQDQSKV